MRKRVNPFEAQLLKYFISKLKFVSLILLIFCISSCDEVTTTLPSPAISLVSVNQINLTSFEIELKVEKGDGQILKNVEIEFDDLTILNSQKITKQIDLTEEKVQDINYVFETEQVNHDFAIKAILNTDKYQYESKKMIYRSTKNLFFFTIVEDELYNYLDPNIAIQLNKGENFTLYIDYLNSYNEEIKIKLNGTIDCEHNIDLSKGFNHQNIMRFVGYVNIPSEVAPGDYDVYVYIENLVYKLDERIRVLEGDWEVFNTNYPGEKMGEYAWFKIDNDLYVAGGNFNSASILKSPVWCLNLEIGEWQKKKDFSWGISNLYSSRIFPTELSYKNEGYIITQNDNKEIQIWNYDELDDSWEKVTDYPGKGKYKINCFNIKHEIFIGGGVELTLGEDEPVNDFWSFNLETKVWKKLNDYPVRVMETYQQNISCSTNEKGFIFEFPGKLWEFDPKLEIWIEKVKFPGPFKHTSRMVAFNNDIFLLGGYSSYLGSHSFKDCWQFSTKENSWKLIAFLPHSTNFGICTSYNNSILLGLGYANHYFDYYDDPVLYQLSLF